MAPYAIQCISNLQVMTAWKIAKHRSGDEAGFPPMGDHLPVVPFHEYELPVTPKSLLHLHRYRLQNDSNDIGN